VAHPELVGHTRGVIAAALSVDGRWLASASQGELLLWDLEGGGHRRLHGHAEWVNGLAFSRDGRQLASAGADGTLRLWPVETVRLARAHQRRPRRQRRAGDHATCDLTGDSTARPGDEIGRLLADHDDGRVGVAADDRSA
jgi:WD40 repeat protein